MPGMRPVVTLAVIVSMFSVVPARPTLAQEETSPAPTSAKVRKLEPAEEQALAETLAAMKRAAKFYREQVASHGGYGCYYSLDLKKRYGEGPIDLDTLCVQPPGTPTVGMAYLQAYQATQDEFYLQAALETGEALVAGQLESGGWTQTIHFGPAKRLGKYRTRPGGDWNQSSLDDDQTQSALRFLLTLTRVDSFKNKAIREAAEYGVDRLIAAQFPNGAFPQVFREPAAPHPITRAVYPRHDWKTEGRVKNYWDYYTLNDDLAGSVAATLGVAWDTAKAANDNPRLERAVNALHKLGDFLVLAQMPGPQPGWCQQYNYEMEPIWARKFEPPAISGGESQDVMRTLIKIAAATRDRKYLAPIPAALAYFRDSLLPDGRVARFYELRTNKPLYMNKEYQLTYDDTDAPTHYGWQRPAKFDAIEAMFNHVQEKLAMRGDGPVARARRDEFLENAKRLRAKLLAKSPQLMAALDDQGRWVSTFAGESLLGSPKFARDEQYLSSAVFAKNLRTLAECTSAIRLGEGYLPSAAWEE